MIISDDFCVKSKTVPGSSALEFAFDLERCIGEVMSGKRKPAAMPIEPMVGLIQFARDNVPSATTSVPADPVGAEPGTVPAPEWQLRVLKEKIELDKNLAKLETFIAGPGLWKLHLEDAKLLQDQALFMRKYSMVLEKRIARFVVAS